MDKKRIELGPGIQLEIYNHGLDLSDPVLRDFIIELHEVRDALIRSEVTEVIAREKIEYICDKYAHNPAVVDLINVLPEIPVEIKKRYLQ